MLDQRERWRYPRHSHASVPYHVSHTNLIKYTESVNPNRIYFFKASLLQGNPMEALGAASAGAKEAAEVGAKLTSNVGGFFKSFF